MKDNESESIHQWQCYKIQDRRKQQKIRSEPRELGEARSPKYLLMYTPFWEKHQALGWSQRKETTTTAFIAEAKAAKLKAEGQSSKAYFSEKNPQAMAQSQVPTQRR